MPYRIICQRNSADSETRETLAQDLNAARAMFDHHVAMAVQHAEWCKVQVVPVGSERNPDPRPLLVYDSHGVDVEVINEDVEGKGGTYRWKDARGTMWLRPTAYAYATTCAAYNKLRYGDDTESLAGWYGVKETGSDKWAVAYLEKGRISYRFTSSKYEATRFDDIADARRMVRAMRIQDEPGTFAARLLEPSLEAEED